jgi:hypothetical protein
MRILLRTIIVYAELLAEGNRLFYSERAVKGTRGSIVVKALSYKPEGRGFDTR